MKRRYHRSRDHSQQSNSDDPQEWQQSQQPRQSRQQLNQAAPWSYSSREIIDALVDSAMIDATVVTSCSDAEGGRQNHHRHRLQHLSQNQHQPQLEPHDRHYHHGHEPINHSRESLHPPLQNQPTSIQHHLLKLQLQNSESDSDSSRHSDHSSDSDWFHRLIPEDNFTKHVDKTNNCDNKKDNTNNNIDDYDDPEEDNETFNTSYNDKVGSLQEVSRSILQRHSILSAGSGYRDDYNCHVNNNDRDYHVDDSSLNNSSGYHRRSLSANEVFSGNCRVSFSKSEIHGSNHFNCNNGGEKGISKNLVGAAAKGTDVENQTTIDNEEEVTAYQSAILTLPNKCQINDEKNNILCSASLNSTIRRRKSSLVDNEEKNTSFCPASMTFSNNKGSRRRSSARFRMSSLTRDSYRDSITSTGSDDLASPQNIGESFDPPQQTPCQPQTPDPSSSFWESYEPWQASQRQLLQHQRRQRSMEEESYISETELRFKGEEGFEESVVSIVKDLPDALRMLRHTRAISALANRLMAAPDEATCIEEVTRLMVVMFGVDRVSFAMLTGTKHFTLKRINVKRRKNTNPTRDGDCSNPIDPSPLASSPSSSSFDLEYLDSDDLRPLAGTAAGVCVDTLKEHYTPRTAESSFATHKVFYQQGLNTVLATPILVNGNKCAGCILLSMVDEDAFKKPDRVLISDIASLLGANIYSKRLRKASEESNKMSREMLHSFIPPKVLEKIECFWDASSEEYQSRKNNSNSPDSSIMGTASAGNGRIVRSNSWYVAHADWSEAEIEKHVSESRGGVQGKIQLIKNMNRENFDDEAGNVGVISHLSSVVCRKCTERVHHLYGHSGLLSNILGCTTHQGYGYATKFVQSIR